MASSQEKRSISAPLSKRRATGSFYSRLPLLIIMLMPLVIILLVIYFLSMYNTMVVEHKQQQHHKTPAKVLGPDAEKLSLSNNLRSRENKEISIEEKNNEQIPKIESDKDENKAKVVDASKKETLILTTSLGAIRIVLRPDLSPGSVAYIHRVVESKICKRCNFYRAEKPGIFQGVLANKDLGLNTEFGICPSEEAKLIKNKCPAWDKNCACHGPLMTKGDVAWAAGQAGGPDFFINNYKRPATHWGTQHTNFGHVEDEESFAVIDRVWDLPMNDKGGMHYLKDHIPFTMEIVSD